MGDSQLYEAVAELPSLDLRLQLPLPRLLSPALERLRLAMADEAPTSSRSRCHRPSPRWTTPAPELSSPAR